MHYVTRFYCPCPVTGEEIFVEVYLFRDEAPADWVEYWGHSLALLPTNEVYITSVFRNGNIWEDYPDAIEKEVYAYDWLPIRITSKRA